MAKACRVKDRLLFDCPGCKCAHGPRVEGSGAWKWNGSLESPTLSPSILVNHGKANPTAFVCHSYVENGKIRFLNDCDHELAGQTVDLPVWN